MRLDVLQKSLDIDGCSPFFLWNILRYILRAKCVPCARLSVARQQSCTLLNVPRSNCIYHQIKLEVSNSINCARKFFTVQYTCIFYTVLKLKLSLKLLIEMRKIDKSRFMKWIERDAYAVKINLLLFVIWLDRKNVIIYFILVFVS